MKKGKELGSPGLSPLLVNYHIAKKWSTTI